MAGLGTHKNPMVLRVQSMEKAQMITAACEAKGWKAIVGIEPDKPEDLSDLDRKMNPPTVQHTNEKTGRNDLCPCGSGRKFKRCCLREKASTVEKQDLSIQRCGLCGANKNLIKTECCNNWICDDESSYVMFSFARNSCHRNHNRYTLCESHYHEDHPGTWQECSKCKDNFETEMYVYYGTNEYNFEKLTHPPEYKPTRCSKCKSIIHLGEDGYTMKGSKYYCMNCFDLPKGLFKG